MKMKRESDGKLYFPGAFLWVPDRRKPSKWDLRFKEICEDGKCRVTRRQLDFASLPFSPLGPSLHPIRIPLAEQARIKKSLISLYRSMGVSEDEIPAYLCEFINESGESIFEGRMQIHFEGSIVDEHVERKRFNKDTGVLENLAMLSPISMNQRRYLPQVMETAVNKGVYEGAPCFINHTDKVSGRSLYDLAGHWKDVKYDQISERVRGDLHSMRQHRDLIFDVVENAPEHAAPSHVCGVVSKKVKDGNGDMIEDVTNIAKCYSVDIVVGAATISSIKEGIDMGDLAKATLESLRKERPDLIEAIRLEHKDDEHDQKGGDDQREYKALFESEKTMREKAEQRAEDAEKKREDEKKARDSQEFLEAALAESVLPDPAQEMIRKSMENKILTEAEADKIVKTQVEYLEKVFPGKKLEKTKRENKAKLPTNENEGENEEKSDTEILTESLCAMGGLEIEKKKKEE
jgi:hypothetical protein